MLTKVVNELNRKFETEGNGITITMKSTGKKYQCWKQECGTYRIDDKLTVWDNQTFCKIVNSIEELANIVLGLSK